MKKAIWLDNETWACLMHLPMTKLPASMERCWYKDCSERPPIRCHLDECHKPRRSNSKYCSVECKNKNARRNYNNRQKTKGGQDGSSGV